MDLIDRLVAYDHWATTQLLDTSSALTEVQLDQEFNIGHRTLRATIDHIITNTQGWMIAMGGQPGGSPPGGDPALPALRERFEGASAAFAAYVHHLKDENRLDEHFIDSYGETISQSGAILHVLLHNVEHRSELLHMLERLDVPEVPEIDMALWEIERLSAGDEPA